MAKTKFKVFTYEKFDKSDPREYVHWSEGLIMVIQKEGVTLSLDPSEIRELIEALPRTIGGKY